MKRTWLIVFGIVLLTDIVLMQSGLDSFRMISKPLILFSLLIYFIAATSSSKERLRKLIIGALIFSFVGDILLLFEINSPLFFMTGLASFLIAHVFYIIGFNRIRLKERIAFHYIFILPVIFYYVLLIFALYQSLGDMKLPVMIYGLVISTMLAMALQLKSMHNQTAGRLLVIGALLFVCSDSVLAFNKFYGSWQGAGILIMLTYGLAQLFIVIGSVMMVQETELAAETVVAN